MPNSENTTEKRARITPLARIFSKAITVILSIALCSIALPGCSAEGPNDGTLGMSAASARLCLMEADTINIHKDIFSIGDHWTVTADGKKVADIKGEFIRIWDCYVMRSTNGDFMCAEEEQFSVIMAKARKLDEEGNEIGRYDQRFELPFLHIDYTDAQGDVIAKLSKNFSYTMDFTIKNAEDKDAWQAKGQLFAMGRDLNITRDASSKSVPAEDAVMMTAIACELSEHHGSLKTLTKHSR